MAGASQADCADRDAARPWHADAAITAGIGQWAAIQSVAPGTGHAGDPNQPAGARLKIERSIADFARAHRTAD